MHTKQLVLGLLLAGAYCQWVVSVQAQQRGGWHPSPELRAPRTSRRAAGPISQFAVQSASQAAPQAEEVFGEEPPFPEFTESAGNCGCGPGSSCDACLPLHACHDACGHWIVLGEATFFRYYRADGARVGDDPGAGDNVEFDFEAAPRVTLGYAGSDGMGIRFRWWEFNQNSDGGRGVLGVSTYNLDLELFDTIQLNSVWSLQASAGSRWNEFDEQMFDRADDELRRNEVRGFGGIVGVELRRCLTPCSSLFGGVKLAVLMDDKFVSNVNTGDRVTLLDSSVGMVEIAAGYEFSLLMAHHVQMFGRVAGEWQNWYNYSSSFGASEQVFQGASDVGFGGVTLSVGWNR